MTLDFATALAEKIISGLAPFCHKLDVAGSIRRRRPECGDIDIVCLVSDHAGFRRRTVATHPRILRDGRTELSFELSRGVQVDLWFAEPGQRDFFGQGAGNYGSLLLCRTGSAAHNIFLVEHAKRLGMRWNPYHGVYDQFGKCVASETEEAIFAALQLDFIPPEARER